jgi:large subunit ribosomal protein L9
MSNRLYYSEHHYERRPVPASRVLKTCLEWGNITRRAILGEETGKMKVVLLQDVYKRGVAGEVVDVANGFARNYLIPQGMAVKATPLALKRSEELRAQAAVRRAQRDEELGRIAEMLQDVTLLFGMRAGETGKLYGSVTQGDVADALLEELGIEFDRRRVGDRPLRELGEHRVPVRLSASLIPTIRVVVYREGEEPPSLEAAAEETAIEEAEEIIDTTIEAADDLAHVLDDTPAEPTPEETGEEEVADASIEAADDLPLALDDSPVEPTPEETEAEEDADAEE